MLLIWSSSFLFPVSVVLFSGILFLTGKDGMYLFSIYVFEMSYDSLFLVDFISLSFFIMVGIVSSSVLIYSVDYMIDSIMKKKFIITMVVFISSMFLLSMSADLFWVMVGWDGLGLSSLCLIMFFQNWKSFNSSMVTFLSNRMGDVFILLSLIWLVGVGVTYSFSSLPLSMFVCLLVIGGFSKSAQVPFSAWLPLAMAAPTPVSSLVHSSTLVTAGVYLLLRFNSFLSSVEKDLIFFISSLTILLSALSSMGEYDLKKIIALSTLSHIGLMMFFLSISSFFSVLIHLHAHAMFKSLLFMIAGDLIHKKLNSQDVRSLNISMMDYPTGVSMVVSLLSMIGFPFLSGFFSKELFLQFSSKSEMVNMLIFIIAASLTSSYSMRILFSLLSNSSNSMINISYSPNWKVFSPMVLFSVMSGGGMVYLSKSEGMESFPLFPSSFLFKKGIFLFLFVGLILGVSFSFIQGVTLPFLLNWIHSMWWVSSMCFFFQKKLFLLSWKSFIFYDAKGIIDSLFYKSKEMSEGLVTKLLSSILSYPLSYLSLSLSILPILLLMN